MVGGLTQKQMRKRSISAIPDELKANLKKIIQTPNHPEGRRLSASEKKSEKDMYKKRKHSIMLLCAL